MLPVDAVESGRAGRLGHKRAFLQFISVAAAPGSLALPPLLLIWINSHVYNTALSCWWKYIKADWPHIMLGFSEQADERGRRWLKYFPTDQQNLDIREADEQCTMYTVSLRGVLGKLGPGQLGHLGHSSHLSHLGHSGHPASWTTGSFVGSGNSFFGCVNFSDSLTGFFWP